MLQLVKVGQILSALYTAGSIRMHHNLCVDKVYHSTTIRRPLDSADIQSGTWGCMLQLTLMLPPPSTSTSTSTSRTDLCVTYTHINLYRWALKDFCCLVSSNKKWSWAHWNTEPAEIRSYLLNNYPPDNTCLCWLCCKDRWGVESVSNEEQHRLEDWRVSRTYGLIMFPVCVKWCITMEAQTPQCISYEVIETQE